MPRREFEKDLAYLDSLIDRLPDFKALAFAQDSNMLLHNAALWVELSDNATAMLREAQQACEDMVIELEARKSVKSHDFDIEEQKHLLHGKVDKFRQALDQCPPSQKFLDHYR